MEIILTKTLGGALLPMDDEQAEKLSRYKTGSTVRGEFSEVRNPGFFRKWFALVKIAYEAWEDKAPALEYKGVPVLPSFDKFRKDITIMAGYGHPVVNFRHELRMEADSIAFGNMSQEKFEQLYSATINVILAKVLNDGAYTRESLDRVVERVMSFA